MKKEIFGLSISQISLCLVIGFLLGVVGGSFFTIPLWSIVAVGVFSFVQIIFHSKDKRFERLFFVLCGVTLGFLQIQSAVKTLENKKEFEFSGKLVITKEPELKDDYQKIVVGFDDASLGDEEAVIFTRPKPSFKFGDVLDVSCLMKLPENKHQKFNYRRFLAVSDIYYICSRAKVEKMIQEKKVETIKGMLFGFRSNFERRINQLLPQPESAYLAGLLLGGDGRLPVDVAEDFRLTGTTHTVAVSGYNITIIASVLMYVGILMGLWRRGAFYFSLLGIVVFVVIIGSPSSATRAAIMGALLLWAMQRGRLSESIRIAIFVATAMVAFSPFTLLYDPGFQLSFLATLGIILIYSPFSRIFEIQNDFLELKSVLLVTLSAQLGVLGILIYTFESISLISLLANMLILPLIPYIMLGGFLSVTLSFFSLAGAKIIAVAVYHLLHFEIETVSFLAKISWASIEVGDVGWSWLIGYYLLLAGFVVKLRNIVIVKK